MARPLTSQSFLFPPGPRTFSLRASGRILFSAVQAAILLAWAAGAEVGTVPVTSSAATDLVVRSWQTDAGLPQNTINTLLQTRDGFLWVGTNGGLARFDGVGFRKFGLQEGLRSVLVLALAEDREGALWVGTSGGDLSVRRGDRFHTFGEAEGFPAGADVIDLCADQDGSTWVGTTKGLWHWSEGRFIAIGEEMGLPKKQVRALTQDTEGTLWVSSILEGVFSCRKDSARFRRVEGEGPTAGNVYTLHAGKDGTVWAGAGSGLLWAWDGRKWARFDSNSGLPNVNVMSLASGPDGVLWVGMHGRGLYRKNGDRFVPVRTDTAWEGVTVDAVTVDRDGVLWAGANSYGLHRFTKRLVNFWGPEQGLPRSPVTCVAEDAQGALWAGMSNQGIYRLTDSRFSRREDTPSFKNYPYTYTMLAAPDGSVWAAGEQSLFRFPPLCL